MERLIYEHVISTMNLDLLRYKLHAEIFEEQRRKLNIPINKEQLLIQALLGTNFIMGTRWPVI